MHPLRLNDARCFIAVHAQCNHARRNRGMNASKLLSGVAAFGVKITIGVAALASKLLADVAVFGGKTTNGKWWQCNGKS